MAIVSDAKEFLRQNGVDQWQNGYPDEEMFFDDIKGGESHVVLCDGKIAAVAMLSFAGEPTYSVIRDGEWLTCGEYGVVHRISVARDMRGHGIAAFIFDQAEKICVENSVYSLRADTHEDNIPMRKTLRRCGFSYCGTITVEDGTDRRAYEKRL